MEEKTISIEDNLKELETIISGLEHGDLTLEESLKEFEKGVGIVKASNELLNEAEKRMRVLTEDGGEGEL